MGMTPQHSRQINKAVLNIITLPTKELISPLQYKPWLSSAHFTMNTTACVTALSKEGTVSEAQTNGR